MTTFQTESYNISVTPIGEGSSLVQAWLEDQLVCRFVVKGDIVTLTERDEGGLTALVQQEAFTFSISQKQMPERPTKYIATTAQL